MKILMLGMLGKNLSRQHFKIFLSYFSQKTGFDTSCKLSPQEIVYMKCHILISVKNKKNIINLSSAEFAHSTVSAKCDGICSHFHVKNNDVCTACSMTTNLMIEITKDKNKKKQQKMFYIYK